MSAVKIERCPKCNNGLLGRDEDGQCCLCGWHDYGEMPKSIAETIRLKTASPRYRRNEKVYADSQRGKTQQQLADKYGLTKCTITRILKRGLTID